MRFLAWLGALGVCTATLVSPLAAQEPVFGIGLGRSLGGDPIFGNPVGNGVATGGRQDSGWQFQTFSEWSPARTRVTFRAEALYSRLTVQRNLKHWFVTGGSILTPQPGAKGFKPYVIAGGSLYVNPAATDADTNTGAPATHWSWVPGLNAGAGFAVDILSLRTGLEVRRHGGLSERDGGAWIALALLVRLP
jgi:hypothetical protein